MSNVVTDESRIKGFVELLKETEKDKFRPMIGCSEAEISDLESQLGVSFPKLYRHFLEVCGKFHGNALNEFETRYDVLKELNEDADEYIFWEEHPKPKNAYVFCTRYREQALYFVCDGTVDPVIWHVDCGGKNTELDVDFLDFLISQLKEIKRLREKNPYSFRW